MSPAAQILAEREAAVRQAEQALERARRRVLGPDGRARRSKLRAAIRDEQIRLEAVRAALTRLGLIGGSLGQPLDEPHPAAPPPPGARMGRPAEPVPADATRVHPWVRVPSEVWGALQMRAARQRRGVSAEVEVAVEMYMAMHRPKLPAAQVDRGAPRRRVWLSAPMVRELDARAGLDAREGQLAAAISWWVRR